MLGGNWLGAAFFVGDWLTVSLPPKDSLAKVALIGDGPAGMLVVGDWLLCPISDLDRPSVWLTGIVVVGVVLPDDELDDAVVVDGA